MQAGLRSGSATLDGLIFYPQAERLQGAQALYQMFMNQALSKEDGLGTIPGMNETIAGPIADQLLNVFASGNPNLVGSSAWQSPGDANAVSPENISLVEPAVLRVRRAAAIPSAAHRAVHGQQMDAGHHLGFDHGDGAVQRRSGPKRTRLGLSPRRG